MALFFSIKRFTSSAAKSIQNYIQTYPVLVFSKSYCPYCKNTKSVLSSMQLNTKVFELDLIPEGADLQSGLLKLTNQDTVPNIFIAQKHIGGNSDLMAGIKSGKIQALLSANKIDYKDLPS